MFFVMKIRVEYEEHGSAEDFYKNKGSEYYNPHEREVRLCLQRHADVSDFSLCLDLAAGSGEVSRVVREMGGKSVAMDPYTWEAYEKKMQEKCWRHRMEDVEMGNVTPQQILREWKEEENKREEKTEQKEGDDGDLKFSSVVCSFALHLYDESRLPSLLWSLTEWAPTLIVLTPHKRPHIRSEWGWQLQSEHVVDRVRIRKYKSVLVA